jgi:hypothetical protein
MMGICGVSDLRGTIPVGQKESANLSVEDNMAMISIYHKHH